MGNQGKIAKKQSSKMYVVLHISVLEFHFREKTFTVNRQTPFLHLLAFLSRLSYSVGI